MWCPCRHSPRAAIAVICGCTLVSLYLFERDTWRAAAQVRSVPEQFLARYEPLGPLLPPDEAARFLVDLDHADVARMHPSARLYIAQYAVSPRRLWDKAVSHWVVVDSDRAEALPEIAASAHWRLVADLHNGVRLYRTDARD
jgi:hypothetical protein